MKFFITLLSLVLLFPFFSCGKKIQSEQILNSFSGSMDIRPGSTVNNEIIALKKQIKKTPDDPMLYKKVSELSLSKKNVDEAMKNAREAIKLKPNMAEGYYLLATSWLEKENFTISKEYFIKALSLKEDYADAHYGLATCYVHEQNLSAAKDEYLQALHYQPDHVLSHNNLGSILLQQNDAVNALVHFKKAADLSSHQIPFVVLNLGIAYEKTGNKKMAAQTYAEYLKIDPSNKEVQQWLKNLN